MKQTRSDTRMERGAYLARIHEFAARGIDLPQSKLTDLDVIDIRSAKRQRDKLLVYIKAELSNEALCKRYGIHIRTLEKVLSRQSWCHLP